MQQLHAASDMFRARKNVQANNASSCAFRRRKIAARFE
jgi:hypothetical protein